MERNINYFSSCYQEFLKVSSISNGTILPSNNIEIQFSESALSQEKSIKTIQHFINKDHSYTSIGFPVPLSEDIKIKKYSPSRKLVAIVRKNDEKSGKKDTIEIWSKNHLVKTIHMVNCSESESVEPICTDKFFGGLSWSYDEKYITFTTKHDKWGKSDTFYNIGRGKSKEYGNKYSYEENWGDSKEDMYYNSLWIGKVESDSNDTVQVRKISSIDQELNIGHPIWTPNSSGIIFVGQKRYERRLGHVYCPNRASGLYHLKIEASKLFNNNDSYQVQQPNLITQNIEEDFGARFPSFSPNGSNLVYVTPSSVNAHSSCFRIRCITWDSNKDSPISNYTIIDKVDSPKNGEFPGIYCECAPDIINWHSATTFFIKSKYYFRKALLLVDIESKKIENYTIDKDKEDGSYSILDCFNDKFLITYSTPTSVPELFLCDDKSTINIPIDIPKSITDFTSKQKWKVISNNSSTPGDDGQFESLLMSPKESGKYPLIAYPHGGPHSWMGAEFVGLFSYFVSIGYHVLLVNYRGSLGYGEKPLESLFGKCGFLDTQDVMDAINFICYEDSTIDSNKLAIAGGSHGGFIAGHLIGQFPDKFKAAVMRNPVTNMASMVSGTDIPAWCELEGCGNIEGNGFAGDDGIWQGIGRKEVGIRTNEDKIVKMFRASPMYHVQRVKTPTIIVIGKNDKRVPNYQGKEFYYHLKANNVPCKIFAYEQPHAITKVDLSYDAWMNISLWLEEHVMDSQ